MATDRRSVAASTVMIEISTMERRRSPRIPLTASVQIQIDDLILEVPAHDVSLHGMAVTTDDRVDLAEGDLIAIVLSETLRLPAVVILVGEDRLHLAFSDGKLDNVRAFLEVLDESPAPGG